MIDWIKRMNWCCLLLARQQPQKVRTKIFYELAYRYLGCHTH